MYSDEETTLPASTEKFWQTAQLNFEHARHILEDYPLEHKSDAVADDNHAPMLVIAFRNGSADYDMREHFLEMGRQILPRVAALIKSRQLSAEFAHEWGKLMFCHGYVASYVFDDSDPVHAERAARKSAESRSKEIERRWLAHVFDLPRFRGLKRAEADYQVALFIAELATSADGSHRHWLSKFLDSREEGSLRSTYLGKNFLIREMSELRALGIEGLPPIPKIPS